MALSPGRIHTESRSPYLHEQQGIDFALGALPDVDPYNAWPLVEIHDEQRGRLYQIDLLLLGRHALYLVELKADPGVLTGDSRDWRYQHAGHLKYRENPYSVTDLKAKVLKSRLGPEWSDLRIEPLIFLSNPDTDVQLQPSGRTRMVARKNFARAITHAEYEGADRRGPSQMIDRRRARDLIKRLAQLGLRKTRRTRKVKSFLVGELLLDAGEYQDYEGRHESLKDRCSRIRLYPIKDQHDRPNVERLRRIARREAERLQTLSQRRHPNVLPVLDFDDGSSEDSLLGPAVVYDVETDLKPLDAFLKGEPTLSLDERVELVETIGRALAWCHREGIVHRSLDPASVLVRRFDDRERAAQGKGFQVRLFGFHNSVVREGPGATQGLYVAALEVHPTYQAPEVRQDPAQASPASDVFSFGCLAYLILVGRPAAENIAAYNEILHQDRGFLPSRHREDLRHLDQLFLSATHVSRTDREDDADAWITALYDRLTEVTSHHPRTEVDPLTAAEGDRLAGRFDVVAALGQGATARVLKVREVAAEYALKVANPGCDQVLADEAATLARLDHPAIVKCHERLQISGRTCLLLQLAGDGSLAGHLAKVGTVPLDLARRFGDDILDALEHLESRGVQHRDLKPANIGFPRESAKKAAHLRLFDFSLSQVPADRVSAGTAAWRDPFLLAPRRWDAAADRFSAAAVLYEMLTGRRPRLDPPDSVPQDSACRVAVEDHLFDPGVRDALQAFFRQAFARGLADRHPDAPAMRAAWLAATEGTIAAGPDGAPGDLPADLAPGTGLARIPMSAAARNVLDRAGVILVRELIELPRNILSVVRGCGRETAREVLDLVNRIHDRLRTQTLVPGHAFLPDVTLPPRPLAPDGPLTAAAVDHLADAGITTAAALAQANKDRVERLLARAGIPPKDVRAWLKAPRPSAPAELPASCAAWAREFFGADSPAPGKGLQQVRALLGHPTGSPEIDRRLGLDQSLPIPAPARVRDVAEAFGVKSPVISVASRKHRETWQAHPLLPVLIEIVSDQLRSHAGLATLAELAPAVALKLGVPVPAPAPNLDLRRAAALVRLVAEVAEPRALLFVRHQELGFLACSDEAHALLPALGRAADRLVASHPIPSAAEVTSALLNLVRATGLESAPLDRVLAIAAAASSHAALSARHEIYRRGLDARTALEAAAPSFAAESPLTEDAIRERVLRRFPLAEPLPLRPVLDGPLLGLGYHFNTATGVYERQVEITSTCGSTRLPVPPLSSHPGGFQLQSPEARDAAQLEETLFLALERGHFRICRVIPEYAEAAAERLVRWANAKPVSLSHELIQAMKARMLARPGARVEKLYEADAKGPADADDWRRLCDIANEAAAMVVGQVLAETSRPQLLTQPGLFGRYRLLEPLQKLMVGAHRRGGPAVFLLVPADESQAALYLAAGFVLPPHLATAPIRLTNTWLENLHKGPTERVRSGRP